MRVKVIFEGKAYAIFIDPHATLQDLSFLAQHNLPPALLDASPYFNGLPLSPQTQVCQLGENPEVTFKRGLSGLQQGLLALGAASVALSLFL